MLIWKYSNHTEKYKEKSENITFTCNLEIAILNFVSVTSNNKKVTGKIWKKKNKFTDKDMKIISFT